MKMIWATRGRNWGFRFLRDGGYSDPLPTYEAAFGGRFSEDEIWLPGAVHLAVRFQDPLHRKDSSGRIISHDFVLFDPEAQLITSLADAQKKLWAEVGSEYSDMWDSD